MLALSKIRRLAGVGISLINCSTTSSMNMVPVSHKVPRHLHSSIIKMQEHDDVQMQEKMDLDSEESMGPNRTYWNSVSLLGDVVSEPYPIHRNGELFGYRLKIQTKRKIRGLATEESRIYTNVHDTVCNIRRLFSFIENIKVNDQVFVRGQLVHYQTRDLDEKTYRTYVAIRSIFTTNHP